MKISIRDSQTLLAVSPLEVMAYARSLGWEEAQVWENKAVIWQIRTPKGEEFELLVPLSQKLGDYAARISDALETIEHVTGRSQLQILADLSLANSDTVRVRSASPSVESGTIPLRDGRELINHSYNMMMAAASSAVEARAFYLPNKSDQATNYMHNVRLGQTERGSFVLTLVSPVIPDSDLLSRTYLNTGEVNPNIQAKEEEPFERRVTTHLAHSLESATRVANVCAKTGNIDEFRETIDEGVNANLCDALVGLHESSGEGVIDLSFAWSRGRQAPVGVPEIIKIESVIVPILREASLYLRQKARPNPRELQGVVLKMSRPRPNARGGEVILQSFFDSAWRQVKVKLAHSDYQQAVEAHGRYQGVACIGELDRSGNVYRLKNPSGFRLLRADEFDAGAFRHSSSSSQVRPVASEAQLDLFEVEDVSE